MSRKEYWQNRKDRVSEYSVRASGAIFGIFNSFTVKEVNFFTINVKFKVILSSKSGGGGGGGIFVQAIPHPKSGGGGGDTTPQPPPPGFTPVIWGAGTFRGLAPYSTKKLATLPLRRYLSETGQTSMTSFINVLIFDIVCEWHRYLGNMDTNDI